MGLTDSAMVIIEELRRVAEEESPDEYWRRTNRAGSSASRYGWNEGRIRLARETLDKAGVWWERKVIDAGK